MQVKKNESGSIMVEVIAVLALLGVMGTLTFRQIQRRNEELDNINMASEIRMVKEATTAYIQANKATLEANCVLDPLDHYGYMTIHQENVDRFMPDNWACDPGQHDCIVYDYTIYLTCYQVDSALAGNRVAMYGTVIPNAGENGPMPANFNLRRAARVATLIGSDGGVHEAKARNLQGTMGAWEVDCPPAANCTARNDDFFVATTGMDIYIPETENTPDNAVSVPGEMAFNRLHGTDYFSVGGGGNCVGNMHDGHFAHEEMATGGLIAEADQILDVGVSGCDPVFWVGSVTDASRNRSVPGQVYVKNSLYVGRDNANNRQAIALEKGTGGSATAKDNKIIVYDETGKERLTLNGAGEIIGRTNNATGRGYRIDNDGVTLFEEKEDPTSHEKVQVATMKLTRDGLDTNIIARYHDGGTLKENDVYSVKPAGTSIMNDIRLTTRGGAKLSEILPDYIAKQVKSITQNSSTKPDVDKPTCPRGYIRAISVTPTKYSQYVTEATLELNNLKGNTNSVTATGSHTHNVTIDNQTTVANSLTNTTGDLVTEGSTDSQLTLQQLPPVTISIDGTDDSKWVVGFKYGTDDSILGDHPVTALAQTYCVFDSAKFSADEAINENTGNGMAKEREKKAGVIQDGARTCTSDANCLTGEGEKCIDGYCVKLEKCSEPDGTSLGNHIYCQGGYRVYWECTDDTVSKDCGPGKTCTAEHKCEDSGS